MPRCFSWLLLLLAAGLFLGREGFFTPMPGTISALPLNAGETFREVEGATKNSGFASPPAVQAAGPEWMPGRKVELEDLSAGNLRARTTSIREYLQGERRAPAALSRFVDASGRERQFTAGLVLVKFRKGMEVRAVSVPPGQEHMARELLAQRGDVEFTGLNLVMERQYQPNDAQFGTQWHHEKLGSTNAWEIGLATHQVKVAIVDWPFQSTHPDLADNFVPGWDVVTSSPIVSTSPGDFHSTHSAGLAAAVIDNSTGVAGAGNAQVLPINIKGLIAEMYEAIIWCSENGVRVVNLSWDGCNEDTLNAAALILKEKNNGMVIMAGVNAQKRLDYTNQPAIYAISATDRFDTQKTSWGAHIDFAAPGWAVYSTTSGGSYTTGNGSSYSAPLFAGMVAFMMAINPELGPEEIAQIFRDTADDLGTPGRDDFYGHGRVHFGRAVQEAIRTSAAFRLASQVSPEGLKLTARHHPGARYKLFTAEQLPEMRWTEVQEPGFSTNENILELIVPSGVGNRFFQWQLRVP